MRVAVVARAAGAVAVVLAAGACSVTVTGEASPAQNVPLAALPFDAGERVLAEQMAIFRTWDICAVHDVAAAERLSGGVAFAVRPNGGYDRCDVAMDTEGAQQLFYVSVEIDEIEPGSGPAATIGNRTFPHVASAEISNPEECGYARPVAAGWGLVVRGEVLDDGARSCTLAQDYLAAILPRLDDPPLRSDAGTDPAFGVPFHDPCAGVALLAPDLLGGAAATSDNSDVTVDGPRTCTLSRVPGPGSVRVTEQLVQFESDVAGEATVLDGGRLEATEDGPAECVVTRQVSDTTLLAPSIGYLFRESIAVSAADCATASSSLDRVAASLPPGPAPGEGALRLGSLEDNPVAADVGAPFDPCTTISWGAYPQDVRPRGIDPRPFPSPIASDTLYRVGCDYDSPSITSSVLWGPPNGGFSIDPAVRPGVSTQFAGRPGLEDLAPAGAVGEEPLCLSTMQIGNGIAGVLTFARDGSQVDLCAVNRAVLETLSPLVP